MRWIDKRPEYKSVVLKGVLGEFEKAAYAAVRDSETEGPRKVRGKVIPPTRRPIPATPERVYALAMESIRSNNGDVFSGLMLGAELDDAFQDVLLRAIDNEVRESYSFGTDRLDLDGGASPATEGVIESYELAFRMQDEVPKVMDIAGESRATLERYGVDGDATDAFGRQCLMARRLVERLGVPFGDAAAVEEAAALIQQLDSRPDGSARDMHIFDLRNGEAVSVAPLVTSMLAAPSLPMPVRITPSAFLPAYWAADANSTSTDGRCRDTSGPSRTST